MATIPAYAAPYVGPAGLVVSSYQSILQDNVSIFKNIYGQNQYTGYSSAIYQLLSALSLKHSDTNAGLQLVYNQLSPQTSVGTGLDRNLKFNGLARLAYTFSTVQLTLTGTSGVSVTIANGAAQDTNGNIWQLPSSVIIPTSGVLTGVTAICTTPGAITASLGTVTIINTPSAATPSGGWTGVTNPANAAPGDPVEADSQAKARQALSVARPSLTRTQSVLAAILAVTGVTRTDNGTPTSTLTAGAEGTSIENPTSITDAWGNPPNSISMVVEGGTDAAVAQAIYGARGIGCYTNGTTGITVTDPTNQSYTMIMRFSRPDYLQIFVIAQLVGYGGFEPNSATISTVQTALVNYLNALDINETVSISALIAVGMDAGNSNLFQPSYGFAALYIGTAVATPTFTTVVSTNTTTVSSAAGLSVGDFIVDPNGLIQPNTRITNISGTTVTMSTEALVSGTTTAPVVAASDTADIPMPNHTYVAQTSATQVQVVVQ